MKISLAWGTDTSTKLRNYLITLRENMNTRPLLKKKVDHLEISSKLLDLANIEEDNKNNNNLSAFYKFISEQLLMINTTFNKRTHPADSFTIACGLHLHNNSTHAYEMLRKKFPFILLPDKRTLFDVNQKAAIPPNCFFNDSKSSPHCVLLKNIANTMSKRNYEKNATSIKNDFKLMMALHIDEISAFPRHLYRNNAMHGLSHNDPKNLAKAMLVFLLTTLTGKKWLLIYAVNLFAMLNRNTCIKFYCLL